ncbi:ABC transporter substrate-binding protein [Amnibacterium sp.]|uniref:ABC transporter substrate-binding protein n=1 Tax=Amnibacterium sp. TaxID=1872496 RepID=UPI003F7B4896
MSFRRTRRLALGAIAVAAGLTVSLAGCSSPKATSAGASSITLFNGAVGNLTENWNPLNNTGAALQPTLGVIYEPLFYYNIARAQKPVPELATAFSWNTDGTQLTITTRQGVKWTDGKAFSASDVAYTLNLLQSNPALNTFNTTWKADATDDHTVVVTFPDTSFTIAPQILGNEPMIPEHIWKDIKDPTQTTNTDPVGTGPYKVKSFTPQSYVLTRNTSYWGTGAEAPKIDTVRYISLANADAATSALEAGRVDWMGSFLPTLKQIVQQHPNLSYTNTPQATTALFTCSSAALGCTGPQTDPAVRQALYWAMDRTQLNKQAAAGFSLPGSPSLLLPTVNKANIADQSNLYLPQTADVAKAKSALEGAGWKLGSNGYYAKNGQELDLTVDVVNGWTDYDTICTLLQGQLKAAGIKLNVNEVAQNAWSQAGTSGKFELSVNSVNTSVSTSPYDIYNSYLSSKATAKVGSNATTNQARFSDPTVDAALAKAAATNDQTVQKAQYAKIQTVIEKDMPYVPIYVNSSLTQFNNTRATGWPTASNLYAVPLPWKSWDNGIVLKTIRPVK